MALKKSFPGQSPERRPGAGVSIDSVEMDFSFERTLAQNTAAVERRAGFVERDEILRLKPGVYKVDFPARPEMGIDRPVVKEMWLRSVNVGENPDSVSVTYKEKGADRWKRGTGVTFVQHGTRLRNLNEKMF